MAKEVKRTALNTWHREQGAQMVEFAGWEMPLAYPRGILEEHLSTRRCGGLFDVSHMGRFLIHGNDAVPFLQKVLTNQVLALDPGMAQYTLIPNEQGGAIDDTFLYRLEGGNGWIQAGYLLVVNAANRERDWEWLLSHRKGYRDLNIEDHTDEVGMMALQGPKSKEILEKIVGEGRASLPEPWRNRLRVCQMEGTFVIVSRTGYTGEPLCFELFLPSEKMKAIWERILSLGEGEGIVPAGLGARDTLRLEAGLPLYGHELGVGPEGREIPIFAHPSCRLAVSFSPLKGGFIGREALLRQFEELESRSREAPLPPRVEQVVPRRVAPVALLDQGVARQGAEVWAEGEIVGHVTSGTVVPYWKFADEGILSRLSGERGMRAIALAYLDFDLREGERIEIRQRGKSLQGVLVRKHLSGEAPPYARPILATGEAPRSREREPARTPELASSAERLLQKAIENTQWRQRQAINLIPSEQTPSALVRWLTIADPCGRYAEHRNMKALGGREIFYYQGTRLIEEVESLLAQELRSFLGCSEVEMRLISGQMANAAVFGGVLDYLNRLHPRSEPRRIRKVMNHHLGRGGHLSAQFMGALRDFVAFDPRTERPAIIHFPVRKENPYQIDLDLTGQLLKDHQPELIILGKSMVLYKEPVREIAALISEIKPRPILVYDMAHVLGLIGPYFQDPFAEGTDLVTSSTHKTFFGPQRGIIGSNMGEGSEYEDLWKAICRRAFPGSVSNHHLGTLLGLLLAAYEMNAFRFDYQRAILANAKAFALSLRDRGLAVEGDPAVGYTETHQVIVRVGYGKGPEIAHRLEENHIIVNYQAAPDDEGFTAASCLRMGVQEMTRFGMGKEDFSELADYMRQIILQNRTLAKEVARFRKRFTEMKYCLSREQASRWMGKLAESIGR